MERRVEKCLGVEVLNQLEKVYLYEVGGKVTVLVVETVMSWTDLS